MKKQLLVVLGMHRSGTSALTRGLTVLGAELGDNLLAADEQVNAKGFWEDKDILAVNIDLLAALGLQWDTLTPVSVADCQSDVARRFIPRALAILKDKLASINLFGLKDPRVSILLPFWQQVFALLKVEVFYLIASRHPKSVMQSLANRDYFLPEKSYYLWQNHMLACLQHTQSLSRLIIDFDLLMKEPATQLARIANLLQVSFSTNDPAFVEYEKVFLDNSLRHTQYDINDLVNDPYISREQQHLYQLLLRLAKQELSFEDKEYARSLKKLTQHYQDMTPLLRLAGSLQYELVNLIERVEPLQQENGVFSRHITALDEQIAELKEYVAELEPLTTIAEHNEELKQQLAELALQHQQERISYQQLESSSQELTQQLAKVLEENTDLQQQCVQLSAVLNSLSWRTTAPLRSVSEQLRNLVHRSQQQWLNITAQPGRKGSFARKTQAAMRLSLSVSKQPSLVLKGARFIHQHGVASTIDRMRELASPASQFTQAPLTTEQLQQLVILTTPHCQYLAELMQDALAKVGMPAHIIYAEPKQGFSDSLHFVICPQMFTQLPGFYVAYQLEQSVSSRWFTPEYLSVLEHAYGIFDYSLRNIEFLQDKGLSYKQLYYLPVGYRAATVLPKTEQSVDVLFYGDVNNERRKTYIEALAAEFSVKVVSNLFGEALYAEMAKAKVVVNIHYYEGALLETTRLYECLSQQQLVVSEVGSDMAEHEVLREVIDFVPVNDVAAMVERVRYWVSNDQARAEHKALQLTWCEQSPNWFEFYFLRFLMANELISYDQFYEAAAEHIRFKGDFVCLGLPETVSRRADFDKDNHYGIEYFPGLRHHLGWVGCGLSYKFLLQRARDLNLPRFTICEDDVEFYADFVKDYQNVLSYLDEQEGWDLYAGLIAQLHDEVELISCDTHGDKRYLTIDKMVSTVMNVYSERFYNKLIAWDPTNHDPHTNTIDRFIEQHEQMRVITTAKFLVGHKEELDSTLWGFNNQTYAQMITDSESQLAEKLAEFDAKPVSEAPAVPKIA